MLLATPAHGVQTRNRKERKKYIDIRLGENPGTRLIVRLILAAYRARVAGALHPRFVSNQSIWWRACFSP